jgi:L-seryl-tRNA(Ser) seleniumtransferase
LPGQDLPTRLVAVEAEGIEAGEIARRLRLHSPPVFTRVHRGVVLADPRTLLDGDEEILVAAFRAAVTEDVGNSKREEDQ